MVVVRTKKGLWEEELTETDLLWERCPNQGCENKELHYPSSMKSPHCPDCRANLLGSKLELSVANRIIYYLGEMT